MCGKYSSKKCALFGICQNLDRNKFTNYIFIRMFPPKKMNIIITTKNNLKNYWSKLNA